MMYCGCVELVVGSGGGGALADEGVSRGEEAVRISEVGIHHFNLGSQTVDFLSFFIYLMAQIRACSHAPIVSG